jgi:hypothetical protein
MLFSPSSEEREALIKKVKANEPPGGYKDIHTAWYLLYLFGSAGASIAAAYYLGDTRLARFVEPIGLFFIPFILCMALGIFLLRRASKNSNNQNNPK